MNSTRSSRRTDFTIGARPAVGSGSDRSRIVSASVVTSVLVVTLSIVSACVSFGARPAVAQDADARAKALSAVRAAAAARDLEKLQSRLDEAKKLKGEAAYDEECQRLEELADYVTKFWRFVDQAGRKLQASGSDELKIGDQVCAFVEYDGTRLVLRVAGENRRYTKSTLPAKVALTLAQRELAPNAAANKVFFGAFLAMDARGDRKIARQMWDEAARGGVDVKHLLPELDADPPSPTVEIPTLNVQARALLSPKGWALRTKEGAKWSKQPLGNRGVQNDEGRLEVTAPGEASDVAQVILAKQLGPAFVCRVILEDVQAGQRLGLASADGDDSGYWVNLPSGTVLVELARQGGEVKCRVHGKDAEVTTTGKASARMQGVLALTIPGGATTTIAALAVSAR